ncbi:MAG: protein kinase [candidate division Zixibacteria bacterium]|nr:protein kinase [candidate division Zixibacteria bacterium]
MSPESDFLEIVKPLGLNPEAGVWLARDLLSDQRMVLRESGGIASAHGADLVQQVRLLRQLDESGFTGAEDIVWRDGTHPGFTARFVDSRSLNAIASEFGGSELIKVLRLICQSMAYLHSIDFLHGDLKPDNILVDTESGAPIPRLTDLGLAVRPGTQLPTEIRGSRGYMSPEILEGQPLTEAIDIYSFGRIVEELANDPAVSAFATELLRLSQDCTDPRPEKRPRSFWDVEYRLSRLNPRRTTGSIRRAFSPPLRPVGLRLRLRLAARMMARDGLRVRGHRPSRYREIEADPGILP